MNVLQLVNKALVVANVVIVVARLPEPVSIADQPSRHALLESLDSLCQVGDFRFTDEQMYVFGHHHIPVNTQLVSTSHLLQCKLERAPRYVVVQ